MTTCNVPSQHLHLGEGLCEKHQSGKLPACVLLPKPPLRPVFPVFTLVLSCFQQIWAHFQHPTPLTVLSSNISFWKKSMFNKINSPVWGKEKTEYSHFYYKKPYVSLFFLSDYASHIHRFPPINVTIQHVQILWNTRLNFLSPSPLVTISVFSMPLGLFLFYV